MDTDKNVIHIRVNNPSNKKMDHTSQTIIIHGNVTLSLGSKLITAWKCL